MNKKNNTFRAFAHNSKDQAITPKEAWDAAWSYKSKEIEALENKLDSHERIIAVLHYELEIKIKMLIRLQTPWYKRFLNKVRKNY